MTATNRPAEGADERRLAEIRDKAGALYLMSDIPFLLDALAASREREAALVEALVKAVDDLRSVERVPERRYLSRHVAMAVTRDLDAALVAHTSGAPGTAGEDEHDV